MAVQKVYLRVSGLRGDAPGTSLFPERALPSGHTVTLTPDFDPSGAYRFTAPDGKVELTTPVPIECKIIDGQLTHRGQPFVWIPVAEASLPAWTWTLRWGSDLHFGAASKRLRDFSFRVDAATPEQIADNTYAGVNLAPLYPGLKSNTGVPYLQGPAGPAPQVTLEGSDYVFRAPDGSEVGRVPALTEGGAPAGDIDGGTP